MHLPPRTSHARLLLGAFAAICFVSLSLAACGGDDDEGDGDGQAQGPVAASAPAKNIVAQIPAWSKPGSAQASDTYVGAATPGGDPYVAVVHQKGQVVVYLCDGKKFWDWFGGKASGGHFDLKSKKGTRITGDIAGGKLRGNLTLPGGKRLSYSAKLARSSRGDEGLFVGPAPTVGYTRRWIALRGEGIRGIDSDTGPIKGAVAGDSPTTTAAGCTNIIPNGCSASCAFLESMADFAAGALVKAKTPSAKDRAFNNLHNINRQRVQNGCEIPETLPTAP